MKEIQLTQAQRQVCLVWSLVFESVSSDVFERRQSPQLAMLVMDFVPDYWTLSARVSV